MAAEKMEKELSADAVIIGGGPSGLTAGIYLSRGGAETLLFEKSAPGGQMASAELIENYPGFPDGISGIELSDRMRKQAERFNLRIKAGEVASLARDGGAFVVEADGRVYRCLSAVLAVGWFPARLNIPGEADFTGKGVAYCATCDGPLFSGREIAVIGGGNTALHEAITLAKFAAGVKLIHRRKTLRAEKSLQERFFSLDNAEFIPGTVATKINGSGMVESVTVRDLPTQKERDIKVAGVFIAVGYSPGTGFLGDFVELDEQGFIITGARGATSAEGVFACGDAVSGRLRQVSTACGSGAEAGIAALEFTDKIKGTFYGQDNSFQGADLQQG